MTITLEDTGTTAFAIRNESLAVRAVKDFTAGWIGGLAQVLSGQPFDTVKVRLQTQSTAAPLYSNATDCVIKTFRAEGIAGFYRGTLMPSLGIGLCVAIQFGALEGMKRFYTRISDANRPSLAITNRTPMPLELTPRQFFASGIVAGLVNSIVAGPVEHIRIRCQAAKNLQPPANFTGPIDCLRQIRRLHGITGLYKGQVSTMLRDGLGFGAYFLAYEYLIQRTVSHERLRIHQAEFKRNNIPAWKLISFGGLAGLAFWIPVFPVDVIKSRIQTDSFDPSFKKYSGTLDCARKLAASEGLPGFFKGFTPCILRAAPVNAATFVAFELSMRALS